LPAGRACYCQPNGEIILSTSHSLLERIQQGSGADAAWHRLVAIYTPVLYRWLNRCGMPPANHEDVTQEILIVVARQLPYDFRHNGRKGAFRAWLEQIARYRAQEFWRAKKRHPANEPYASEMLRQLADPSSAPSQYWKKEYNQHLLKSLLELVEADFQPNTWQAFYRTSIDDVALAKVAADLRMTVNAVMIARSRVLSRLREEGNELIDEGEDLPYV